VSQRTYHHTFENGLTLLGEEMPWLESAAFAFLIRAGAVHDPADRLGLSNLTCDMLQRGSGDLSNREFVEALERLGIERASSVSLAHSSYSGATLASNLLPTISHYADLLRRPQFPEDQLEESRQVCFQELRANQDDLAQRTLERVRQLQYPAPWGRSVQGTAEDVAAISIDDVRQHFQRWYNPTGSIVSVAGKINWAELKDHVGQLFADWSPQPEHVIEESEGPTQQGQILHDSAQTHIAISYPSVPYRHEDYYQARAAVGVLSDGMSSRLFKEIREKEGLCYTIYATVNTLRDRGSVICYGASSTERAQELCDRTLHELKRMEQGVQETELDRLKARIKSSLIMQQESSASRSVSMAIDWYHLGLIRSMKEVSEAINSLTAESISDYLKRNPPKDFKVAAIGAKALEVSV